MLKTFLKFVDNFLNRTTMYRLTLYYLGFLIGVALILGFFKVISISPYLLTFSTIFLLSACFVVNKLFSYFSKAPANVESFYITALILVLITYPARSLNDFVFLLFVAILAIASKYLIAIRYKHIFNPAAFALVITWLFLDHSAGWWVGTLPLAPFVLLGGILIIRKIKKFDLVFSYLITFFLVVFSYYVFKGEFSWNLTQRVLFESPLLFFVFVMLTEPLTTPPTRKLRIIYGVLVGFLSAPQIHFGSFYLVAEATLIIGNVFSYIVSPKQKLLLKLEEKIKVANDTYNFKFKSYEKLLFKPGQYLEWTLPQDNSDSRGNRRYFTIASSPTEEGVLMGVKFYDKPSSFKEILSNMEKGDEIIGASLAGDFVMPKDKNQKLVFIAGGIGVTPFRSMVKYLLDMNEKRNIILFYSNNKVSDIAYKDIFDSAKTQLGIKTVYTLTDKDVPIDWNGKRGFVDEKMIREEVPDYQDRIFYISGPHSMVTFFEDTLKKMGIKNSQIRTDYFPGFV